MSDSARSNATPCLRMVGGLQTRGREWDMDALGALFGRLGAEVPRAGDVLRHVGYEGLTGEAVQVRFFGVEVDRIEGIPEGMVGLEVQGDSLSVFGSEGDAQWRGDAMWRWTSASETAAMAGEFAAGCPAEWLTDGGPATCEFHMTSNAYFARDVALDDSISIVNYDPAWPGEFEIAANWLRESLSSDLAPRIEHYGSTAIPNMPAKPIIDVLVEAPSLDAARERAIDLFNKPGCEYWWYKDHMTFIVRQRPMGRRTHHFHVAPAGHQLWDGIVFRDYLRTHPDDAAAYADLKRDLAERFAADRERYTDAKHEFVMKILALAGQG